MEDKKNKQFSELFKEYRLRSGISSLEELADEINNLGYALDPSQMSHWQRGARLPKDRNIILSLIKIFVKNKGITSISEANSVTESVGYGFLTDQELNDVFGKTYPLSAKFSEETKKFPSLKVHFMGAIDGDKDSYKVIIKKLEELGFFVVTKHSIERKIDDIRVESSSESFLVAEKIKNWIQISDIVIFEATKPDISIGYEIALSLNTVSKCVIVLYQDNQDNIPHELKGIRSKRFRLLPYSLKSLTKQLEMVISDLLISNNLLISH